MPTGLGSGMFLGGSPFWAFQGLPLAPPSHSHTGLRGAALCPPWVPVLGSITWELGRPSPALAKPLLDAYGSLGDSPARGGGEGASPSSLNLYYSKLHAVIFFLLICRSSGIKSVKSKKKVTNYAYPTKKT